MVLLQAFILTDSVKNATVKIIILVYKLNGKFIIITWNTFAALVIAKPNGSLTKRRRFHAFNSNKNTKR